MSLEATLAAITAFAIGILPKVIDWIKARSSTRIDERKQEKEEEENDTKLAVSLYRQLVQDIMVGFKELQTSQNVLEKELLETKEQKAVLTTENKFLNQANEGYIAKIKELETMLSKCSCECN